MVVVVGDESISLAVEMKLIVEIHLSGYFIECGLLLEYTSHTILLTPT